MANPTPPENADSTAVLAYLDANSGARTLAAIASGASLSAAKTEAAVIYLVLQARVKWDTRIEHDAPAGCTYNTTLTTCEIDTTSKRYVSSYPVTN